MNEQSNRRRILRAGLGATALFLPVPWALVRAQSDGAVKLLRAPKLALVVGNGGYKEAPELKNAVNDARSVSAVLRELKFNVTEVINADRRRMQAIMRSYTETVAASQGVGLFYFAGHGLQLAWRNYLLPVDAAIDKPDDLKTQGVEVDGLMRQLGKAANPMNLIVLDACRENPFAKDFRSRARGLSQMDAPLNTLLAYATSPGNVASDGEGTNGLYTEHLLREIQTPEAKVEDVFKRVRLGVRLKSNGAQIPWESTSLEEDFWFRPPERLRGLTDEEKTTAFRDELALWEKIRGNRNPGPFEAYLRRYPSGRFSELAQLRLDRALARQGEQKIVIASSEGNPFSKGTAAANTAYRIGDTYSFRITDPRTGAEQPSRTATVERITEDEIIFSNGLVTDLLGNTLRASDGRRSSPRQQFPTEYAVGRQWHSTFSTTTRAGDDEGITEQDAKIVARENITVPAGTFDAFRIEYVGTTAFKTRTTHFRVKRWVAPDQVRRGIAVEEFVTQGTRIVLAERQELVSFRQA